MKGEDICLGSGKSEDQEMRYSKIISSTIGPRPTVAGMLSYLHFLRWHITRSPFRYFRRVRHVFHHSSIAPYAPSCVLG
jgi:hypothetical protein